MKILVKEHQDGTVTIGAEADELLLPYEQAGYILVDKGLVDFGVDGTRYEAYEKVGGRYVQGAARTVVPAVVSMGQARAALIRTGMFDTVNNAILASPDAEMKSNWEYRTEVRRDWPELVTLTAALGITDAQLDELFLLAGTL